MLVFPLNQWPAGLAHSAILELARMCQIKEFGEGNAQSIEVYVAQIQLSWLDEMPPAGNG